MAMSRTARILIAILLLAAAAFFWVNFYTQNRNAEAPAVDPVAAQGPSPAASDGAATDAAEPAANGAEAAEPAASGDAVEAAGEGAEADAAPATDATEAPGAEDAVADGEAGVDADATEPASTITPEGDTPPTVVVDAPIAVGREIVIADLPFLITEPRPASGPDASAETGEETEAAPGVTVPTRATVNPFSPVVVRTPPAPEREVPAATTSVAEVPVPAGPTPAEAAAAAVPAPRADAPTPRAVAPRDTVGTDALRPLPTGSVLAATPQLLMAPRAQEAVEVVEVPAVTAIAVPDAEPADLAPAQADATTADDVADPDPLTTPAQADATTADDAADPDPLPTPAQGDADANPPVATADPPLAAGATNLARYLRDRNYTFTGSVVGPISVGVFRNDAEAGPVVVALGQTLPDSDIVLTDLRGQQAELRLGDSTQILTLDLRR